MAHQAFQGRKVLHKKRPPKVIGPIYEGPMEEERIPLAWPRQLGQVEGERMAPPKVIGPDESLSDHLRHMASEGVLREGHNTLPSRAKAKEMLRHGEARGRKFSRKQEGLLGLIAGGGRPTRMRRPK